MILHIFVYGTGRLFRKSRMLWKGSSLESHTPLSHGPFFTSLARVVAFDYIQNHLLFKIKTFSTVSNLELKMEMCGQE